VLLPSKAPTSHSPTSQKWSGKDKSTLPLLPRLPLITLLKRTEAKADAVAGTGVKGEAKEAHRRSRVKKEKLFSGVFVGAGGREGEAKACVGATRTRIRGMLL
jgi:hypothetical protein